MTSQLISNRVSSSPIHCSWPYITDLLLGVASVWAPLVWISFWSHQAPWVIEIVISLAASYGLPTQGINICRLQGVVLIVGLQFTHGQHWDEHMNPSKKNFNGNVKDTSLVWFELNWLYRMLGLRALMVGSVTAMAVREMLSSSLTLSLPSSIE